MDTQSKELLVFGPRASAKGSTGGVVVLFELFLAQLEERGIRHKVVDTNRKNYRGIVHAGLSFLCGATTGIYGSKRVSVHLQNNDYVYVAPIVVFLAKILRRPVSLRKFAGNFDSVYRKFGLCRKWLVRYAMHNAGVVFFETRYLVEDFSKYNCATYWLPNARRHPKCAGRPRGKAYGRRLVFLGRVCKEKGVTELLQAAEELGSEYSISFYGGIETGECLDIEWSRYNNVSYKGAIPVDEAPTVLARYDVLVLPSYWVGEGYPGVIIEALSVGLPVVASNLRGIREIITDNKEGLLVEPKDVSALVSAIAGINETSFKRMSDAALRRYEEFDADCVMDYFLRTTGVAR